tara:strand:+ start:1953 stop:2192 length:240 start_codon:yes stop_codon:yes gene_type:complete
MDNCISTIRSRQSGRVIGVLQFLVKNWDDLTSESIKLKLEEVIKEDAEVDETISEMIDAMEENYISKSESRTGVSNGKS